jgi:hypothetical protein
MFNIGTLHQILLGEFNFSAYSDSPNSTLRDIEIDFYQGMGRQLTTTHLNQELS